MYQDRIEYLKRAIKRTYKRYIEERTDGKATLSDVAKFFNIPVDESRADDYSIKKIDYNTPSIKINDQKNDITYTANYTSAADLLNYSGEKRFNRVVSISPVRKEESLYYIGGETPIITEMTFSDGEYELGFEREFSNHIGFGLNAESKFAVRYVKNVYESDRQGKQQLLSKVFMNKSNDETFDQIYTYDLQHQKYCYNKNGNVIYGVHNCDIKNLVHYFDGICFESTNVNVSKYLPLNMQAKDFPELTNNKKYQSGIVFRGGTGNGIHHAFTIFKVKNQGANTINSEENEENYDIYLKYEAKKWESFKKENGMPDCRQVIVAHKEARYPRIVNGNITSQEIRNITEVLDTGFEDNAFIQLVKNELKTFANKLDVQKGIVQEEFDPLSPKLFIDKSFDEICALVSTNKDDYFRLIKEQFEIATNINKISEKGQSKVLKPKKLQSSEN